MDRKNPLNIPVEGFQLILSMFLCLILMLKSPGGTSFGLYFAYEEYVHCTVPMTQTVPRTGSLWDVPEVQHGPLKSLLEQYFPRNFSSSWSFDQYSSRTESPVYVPVISADQQFSGTVQGWWLNSFPQTESPAYQ